MSAQVRTVLSVDRKGGQAELPSTITIEKRRGGASQQGLRHNGATLGRPLGLS